MNYDKLVLFQKIYDLILEIHPIIITFPKNERFTLGQKMENTLLSILEIVIVINLKKVSSNYFRKIDVELQKLKIFIRLSKDLRFISIKTYGSLEEKVVEIGKILGGFERVLV
ncbi:MAG: diversity-generating retroelement protein Avd [Candidatus Pacebacteria bacterium]|nr:diversity-generating retroelement protein Avd [Candidatus Paceibacterota bacterium]